MRFYIGTSYKIKTKVIIKFLLALGFLILATLGIDKVHAWTTIDNPNFSSWENNYYSNAENGADNITVNTYTNNYFYNNSYVLYPACRSNPSSIGDNCWNSNNAIQYNSFFSAYGGSSPNYYRHITQEFTYILDNDDYCNASSTSGIESIDFKFKVKFNGDNNTMFSTSNLSIFNQTSSYDLYKFRVIAVDSINELYFSTTCDSTLDTSTNQILEFNVECLNVFRGSTNYNIDKYYISILNGIPFNDLYNSSSNKNIAGNNGINIYPNSSTCTGDYCKFQYQCNSEPPITDGEFPSEDDPTGLNDIYESIKDNYNDLIPGINTENIFLQYPTSFSDIVALPINLINAFRESSEVCTPYSIDLSSISTEWGGSNYSLTLPCMRSYITNIIGSDYYLLFDLLLSSIVFYKIVTTIIVYVEAVTGGDDLFDLFFKGEHSSVLDKKEK